MEGVLLGLLVFTVARLLHREWRARKRQAPRRALERARPTAIASLQEGDLTKISGVIAPRAPMLTSAVERQPCIGYSTAVEEMDDTPWRLIFNSAACASFFVTDESGTAVVEGNIVIALHPDIGWGTPPASLVPRKDDAGSLPSLRVTIERPTRYREIMLKPGDRVSVLGRAKMEIDPAGRSSFRDPPMLNHITGSDDAPVIVAHDMITPS